MSFSQVAAVPETSNARDSQPMVVVSAPQAQTTSIEQSQDEERKARSLWLKNEMLRMQREADEAEVKPL